MSKKDELAARLKALGVELGREVNLSGSNEELVLRITELEEELNDGNEFPGPDTVVVGASGTISSNTISGTEEGYPVVLDTADYVTVTVLATLQANLHIDAQHETLNELVATAKPGTKIRVTPVIADALIQGGLAIME
ncbi:MAG: DNA-packaging protein FI [Enterobacteriaceae bacterium]|nr:DNA-packaging protein FI [Enterobacteriaceae bacterium]